jgi:hypothetical protein
MPPLSTALLLTDLPPGCEDLTLLLSCEGGMRVALDLLIARPAPPTAAEVRMLVDHWYSMPGHGAGGILHVALDDGNLDDGNLRWLRDEATAAGNVLGHLLATVLLRVPEPERKRCLWGED